MQGGCAILNPRKARTRQHLTHTTAHPLLTIAVIPTPQQTRPPRIPSPGSTPPPSKTCTLHPPRQCTPPSLDGRHDPPGTPPPSTPTDCLPLSTSRTPLPPTVRKRGGKDTKRTSPRCTASTSALHAHHGHQPLHSRSETTPATCEEENEDMRNTRAVKDPHAPFYSNTSPCPDPPSAPASTSAVTFHRACTCCPAPAPTPCPPCQHPLQSHIMLRCHA